MLAVGRLLLLVVGVVVSAAAASGEGRNHAPTRATNPSQYQTHDEMRSDHPNALLRALVEDASLRQASSGAAAPHPTMPSAAKKGAKRPD